MSTPITKFPVSVVNLAKGETALPPFYQSKEDEEGEKNVQKVRLASSLDHGVIHTDPKTGAVTTLKSSEGITHYAFAKLRANPMVQLLINDGVLDFRGASLV